MDTKLKKATIIVPVYNGADYLEQSIQSVFNQTYGAIELITVNDGSVDNSQEVLEKLQVSSPDSVEMKIISQENAGICAARNRALDAATGEYVLFMDQDDRMKKSCVKTLVKLLESRNTDMVIGGYALVDEAGKVLDEWKLDSSLPWCKFRISAPWGRIFRRSIINDNNVRFMITKISEDFYFNLVYMSYCKDIFVTPYIGYAWTYRAASESHKNMSVMNPDRNPLVMMTQVLRDMKQPNILEKDLLDYMFIKHIIWYLLYTAKGSTAEEFRRSYDACFAWLKDNVTGFTHNTAAVLRGPRGETAKVRAVVRAALLMRKAGILYPFLRMYAKI